MNEQMNDGHEEKRTGGIVENLGSRLGTRFKEACVLGVEFLSQMIKMLPVGSPKESLSPFGHL